MTFNAQTEQQLFAIVDLMEQALDKCNGDSVQAAMLLAFAAGGMCTKMETEGGRQDLVEASQGLVYSGFASMAKLQARLRAAGM